MDRIYNFSAGPSMLPLPVLEKAASELVNYGNAGMSVMEMSHRSPAYEAIIQKAEADLRKTNVTTAGAGLKVLTPAVFRLAGMELGGGNS
jgi:phosphoserine aminotransferase